jgi:hypothetical protein
MDVIPNRREAAVRNLLSPEKVSYFGCIVCAIMTCRLKFCTIF